MSASCNRRRLARVALTLSAAFVASSATAQVASDPVEPTEIRVVGKPDPAGLLPDQKVPRAQSAISADFIVNADHATAADVDELIRDIQAKVKEQFDVDLEPEVHRVGEFL